MCVTIKSFDNREIILGPAEITEDNVQYYCRHTKELKHSQISKALKFVRFNCIRYLGRSDNPMLEKLKDLYPDAKHFFICLPLNTKTYHNAFGLTFNKMPYTNDYNSSEYIIYKTPDGTFECNCQGFQSKKRKGEIIIEGSNCSHILALFYSFKLKRFQQ